jgi:ABC-2 type transport system ATP-binding protein
LRIKRESVLQVVDLKKYFGRTRALNGISFSLREGESAYLAGPNGSGKTTTLLNIVGIQRPTSGEVLIFGKNPMEEPSILDRVSILSHNLWFYPDMTGLENLGFYFSLFRIGKREHLDRWIEEFKVSPFLNRKVRTYSHGMRKRLALVRTFMKEADLYLLDEPFSGLDEEGERSLLGALKFLKDMGKTLLFTTHRSDVGKRVADRMLLLEKGILVEDRTLGGEN